MNKEKAMKKAKELSERDVTEGHYVVCKIGKEYNVSTPCAARFYHFPIIALLQRSSQKEKIV